MKAANCRAASAGARWYDAKTSETTGLNHRLRAPRTIEPASISAFGSHTSDARNA
jgi:hypothetical protein